MKRILLLAGLAVAVSFCAMTTAAQAQATRTWVSGVGDDANPCSRTAPCKTFAGAISKTANCGEIDALDPGGFGTVTITKGITIDGGGGETGMIASVLASGTPGITVNNSDPTCTKVTIRNLDIQGIQAGTSGVVFVAGSALTLDNVSVSGFTNLCVDFEPAVRASLVISNSNLENCTTGGVLASAGSGGVTRVNIRDTTIHRSGYGVRAALNSDVQISRCMIVNNLGGGVLVDGNSGPALAFIDSTAISNNQVAGIHALNNGIARISNTSVSFTGNGTGLLFDTGGQILSFGNNFVGGNATDGTRSGTIAPI
jgi:hypothetical protein